MAGGMLHIGCGNLDPYLFATGFISVCHEYQLARICDDRLVHICGRRCLCGLVSITGALLAAVAVVRMGDVQWS